jgi:hypothetical protein
MISFTFLYFIAGFIFIVVLSGLIYFLLNLKRGYDEPENEFFLHNFMLQYCPFREGIIKEMSIGEDRIKIVMFPRDINYIKAENDENYFNSLKKYILYYDKRQVEIISGDASPNRTIIKGYPNSIDLLPEGLKKTTEGQAIMKKINENNKIDDESKLMKQRMENLSKIAEKTFGGEIYTDFVNKSKEQMKDLEINKENKND